MSNKSSLKRYSEEFKKTIVTLCRSGKTYSEIQKEYGVFSSALSNWVKNTRKFKWMMTRFSPPNKSRCSNAETLSWKRFSIYVL